MFCNFDAGLEDIIDNAAYLEKYKHEPRLIRHDGSL
jgi:hypothetical protein